MAQSVESLPGSGRLPMREKFGWATGDFAQNLIYNCVSTYLLFFYTNVFGLSPAFAATMFLVVRMIDAINDPIIGTIVDKHTTRWGKYRGWLVITSIPFAIMAILCFYTPSFGSVGKMAYAYVTYIGMSLVYTTVNIPYGSMNAAMTRNDHELISMNSIRMFLAQLGGLVVSFGIPIFVKLFSGGYYSGVNARTGWFLTMSMYGIVGALILLFCFSQTKEHIHMTASQQAEVKVSDLFHQLVINVPLRVLAIFFIIIFGLMSVVNSIGAYYMTYNAGDAGLMQWYNLIGTLPVFVVIPLTPWLNKKMGPQKLMQMALLVAVIGSVLMFMIPAKNIALTFLGRAIQTAGIFLAGTFEWGLVPQTITYGEWKTGKRENGIINAVIGFFFKAGMAMGGVVPGYALAAFGFVANQNQTANSLLGIKLTATLIPAVFCVIAMIVFSFYKLNNEKIEKMNDEIIARKATKK
ncbi:MFS transporter [Paucilactobacillus vaccinostercus]|nr:MFS transporter [Paucilactobacillus vaccinostercus]